MKRLVLNGLVIALTAGLAVPAAAQMHGGRMGGGMGGGQGMGSIVGQQSTGPQPRSNAGVAELSAVMRELADHTMAISTRLAGSRLEASAQRATGEQVREHAVMADRLARIVDSGLPPDVESRTEIRAMRERLAQMPMGVPRTGER